MADLQSPQDKITLRNGYGVPCIGFGTWKMPDGEVGIDAVHQALANGYRHIDTAAAYDNEETVGKALATSGLTREELFVTTKVWNTDRGYDATLKAFEESRSSTGRRRKAPRTTGSARTRRRGGRSRRSTWTARCAPSARATSSPTTWSPSWAPPRYCPW